MDIQAYIESGILEAYLLGMLSADEQTEVQTQLSKYKELQAELDHIASTLQQLDKQELSSPPARLKDKVWNAIASENNTNVHIGEGFVTPPRSEKKESHTIPLQPKPAAISMGRAAVWVAILVSAATNFILLGQRNKARNELTQTIAKTDSLLTAQHKLFVLAEERKHSADMLADSNVSTVVLKTMKPGHPMAVTVFWNKQSGDAYVAIDKLPMPPQGMQYQVWVMQNGKLNNAGILSNDLIASAGMDKLTNKVMEGEAFAVSLEKVGGSPNPDMNNLYVMGKVNS